MRARSRDKSVFEYATEILYHIDIIYLISYIIFVSLHFNTTHVML